MIHTRPCASDHPDPNATQSQCRLCSLFTHNLAYRKLWGGSTEGFQPGAISLPCVHEGAVLEWCNTCPAGGEMRHIRDCDKHGRCTRGDWSPLVKSCSSCSDYDSGAMRFKEVARWKLTDPRGVLPQGRYHFNSSLIEHQGRKLLAIRDGWAGSQIHVAELDKNYLPLRCSVLAQLRHETAHGCEDPRLFVFRNRLHVSYTGFNGDKTSVLYARLTDDLQVEQVFPLQYAKRQHWEKNWVFFESQNELWCVYSSLPDHRVLRVTDAYAEDAHETLNLFPWAGGHHRGGASPVRLGDKFYHFHHGCWDLGESWPTRRYNIGLTVFEANPPFRVTYQTPHPILVADPNTRPGDQYCDVVFPAGAIRDGNSWVLSMGTHDRWTDFVRLEDSAS